MFRRDAFKLALAAVIAPRPPIDISKAIAFLSEPAYDMSPIQKQLMEADWPQRVTEDHQSQLHWSTVPKRK